jgi:signal peptide peptidase SppA
MLPFETAGRTWAVAPDVLEALCSLDGLAATDELVSAVQAFSGSRPRSQTPTAAGVAVVPLVGLITPRLTLLSMLFGGGGGLEQFRADLRQAVASPDVSSIVLNVDSPGGSVELLTETAAELRQARAVKPIVAAVSTLAASAGYWLASQASEVAVTPSGSVGSVGAYRIHVDQSGADAQEGIKPTIVSAGEYKVEQQPHAPLADSARAELQRSVDEHYGQFLADVAAGRGTTAAHVAEHYGKGRLLSARRAVEAGKADRVATIEQVVGSELASASATRADTPTSPTLATVDDLLNAIAGLR